MIRALPVAFFAAALLSGCTGESTSAELGAEAAGRAPVEMTLVNAAWQVRMADASVRAPFESSGAWANLFNRAHDEALRAFAADPGAGRGLARVHLELAELFREAARLNANATRHVYGTDRQPEDPVEVAYLLGASAALLGDNEAANAAFAALPSTVGPEISGRADQWRAWLAAGGVWPPDAMLTDFPGMPGEVVPGGAPTGGWRRRRARRRGRRARRRSPR